MSESPPAYGSSAPNDAPPLSEEETIGLRIILESLPDSILSPAVRKSFLFGFDRLVAERDALRVENMCDVCAGSGRAESGIPCMCSGTGKASHAVPYLRERVYLLEQENASLKAEVERLKADAVSIYTTGYRAGHHDTVEGQFIDVVPHESATYFAETVSELLSELARKAQGGE